MARSKERPGVSVRLGFQLEDLCREILSANGWDVEPIDHALDFGVDIVAKRPGQVDSVAFEIKYTRNSTYPTSALKISAERLIEAANVIRVKEAVLIVAADIKPGIKQVVEGQYGVQVIDLDALLTLASVDLEILNRLVRLCEIDVSGRDLGRREGEIVEVGVFYNLTAAEDFRKNEETGSEYIERLKALPLGREGCYEFEDLVSVVLKYLFDGDLVGWHQQKRTADDLHRYDLICRVLDKSMVWKFISSNLDSRYVLFEFKNYAEEIGQAQVYSTEKYLYEKAKRRVCFLISRKGMSDNGVVACQGAMREHGKLIISLDEDALIDFVSYKMAGNDPNDLLFDKVDNFLMELPR